MSKLKPIDVWYGRSYCGFGIYDGEPIYNESCKTFSGELIGTIEDDFYSKAKIGQKGQVTIIFREPVSDDGSTDID